jgi:hypothetical protein
MGHEDARPATGTQQRGDAFSRRVGDRIREPERDGRPEIVVRDRVTLVEPAPRRRRDDWD